MPADTDASADSAEATDNEKAENEAATVTDAKD